MNHMVRVFLTFVISFLFISSANAQLRDCPQRLPFDQIETEKWRLYFFNRQDSQSDLVYVDDSGVHQTNYSTTNSIVTTFLSPNRQLIAISSSMSDTVDRLEVVNIQGDTVYSDNFDTSQPLHGAILQGWQDDNTIVYESAVNEVLVSVDISSSDRINILLPTLNDIFEVDEDLVNYSPNVLHAVRLQTSNTDAVTSQATLYQNFVSGDPSIVNISGKWISWNSTSDRLFILSDDREFQLYDLEKGLLKSFSVPSEVYPHLGSFSPNTETIIITGVPDTVDQILPRNMFVVSQPDGSFTDICVYETLLPISQGRFNEQIGLWSPDSNFFAFRVHTENAMQLVVLNIESYSASLIGVEYSPIAVVGWVENAE